MELVPLRLRRAAAVLDPEQTDPDHTEQSEAPDAAGVRCPLGREILTPPLLIGGVTITDTEHKVDGILTESPPPGPGRQTVQRGIDALTFTVGTEDAKDLLETSRRCGEGFASMGFRRSEKRQVIGGEAWRRWEPSSTSKEHGSEYECWEASGGSSAQGLALWLPSRLVAPRLRPSRVDIAWTFDVGDHVFPDDVIDVDVRRHAEGLRFQCPVSGTEPQWTRYIGSPRGQGVRLLRVYRKDKQCPELGFMAGGALLRVELVLRAEHAAAFWPLWLDDREAAYASAAAHVRHMTGRDVQAAVTCIPPIDVPLEVDEAQSLLNFMHQYPEMVSRLLDAPADVRRVLVDVAEADRSASSAARGQRDKRRFLEAGGWETVLRVLHLLRAASRRQEVA